jgi:hypothetical protein
MPVVLAKEENHFLSCEVEFKPNQTHWKNTPKWDMSIQKVSWRKQTEEETRKQRVSF